jgi:hypothetical protein
MQMKLPKLLTLAELEHRLSSVPGGPTKGNVWRTLVAAFWRNDLHADNWTREQLRETANLDHLPFDQIAAQVQRRSYHPEFRRIYLDELLFESAGAERCLLGLPVRPMANRPRDDELRRRITKVLDAGRERVERGASFKSVAEWLFKQRKNENYPQETLEKILPGRYPPMKRLVIKGLKRPYD